MKTITTVDEMREYSREAKLAGKTIGLVPTMGYLHDGHMSLAAAAAAECNVVVMSIFVNPTQFGRDEDFDGYPRDMQKDRSLAEKKGLDVVFLPSVEEIYPDGYATYVEVAGNLAQCLCGRSRPGHFRGVTTVVAKLFDIVSPDKSYFGQKDAQQAIVIKRMVRDLNMPVDVRVMPIVREADGLAMSSRNAYLSNSQRRQALEIFRSLQKAQEMVNRGELSAERIKGDMERMLLRGRDVSIDYIEMRDADDLEPLESVRDNTLVAVAVFVGKTRLIDNAVMHM